MGEKESGELKIVYYGHPALRKKTQRVGQVTQAVKDLVYRMVETLRQTTGGIGLAANQVGIPRQVAVIELEDKLIPLIDPKLVSAKGSEEADEGCLSLPRLYGDVARPTHVVVSARDLTGKRIKIEAEGLLARALMHEIDHLNGKLFIDQVKHDTLHWLIKTGEDSENVIQPTTLEEALKVFTTARR